MYLIKQLYCCLVMFALFSSTKCLSFPFNGRTSLSYLNCLNYLLMNVFKHFTKAKLK